MRRLLATSIAAVGAAALTLAPASAAHSDTYRYLAVGGDGAAVNCDGALKVTDVGVGGLCFDILRGDTKVTVTAADDSGVPVGMQLRFRDPANVAIGADRFICGTSGELAIPAGADEILVWTFIAKSKVTYSTATPSAGVRDCNPATQGTMTAAFTS